ncbi:MAG TPA: SUMF1/EgtB/PvdO family nonheme iron enzyme [Stellaceae bacterium]|nr:SUMF1/EgtB/PvdO family nonheme iron enzyme [Stellaceae bacterium]
MPIFISYSSKDQKTAEAICTAIENRGHACWISSRDIGPGENFQTQIVRAIRTAQIMVLVFSSHANNSEEIKKELVLAGQSRLVVIPVRVEDVTPDEAFAYEFATRQWIDVFGDWEHAIQRVVHQIEAIINEGPAHPPLRTDAVDHDHDDAHEPHEPTPHAHETLPAPPVPAKKSMSLGPILAAAGAVIVVLAGLLAWQMWPKPGASPAVAVVPPPASPASVPSTSNDPLVARLAAISPDMSAKMRTDHVRAYREKPQHKALAVPPGRSNVWFNFSRPSADNARDSTLELCQIAYDQPCALIAVDDTPQPVPRDGKWQTHDMPRVQYAGDYDPTQMPGALPDLRERPDFAGYRGLSGAKAIAFHVAGTIRYFIATSADQRGAEADALRRCDDDDRGARADLHQCFLYASGTRVVFPQRLREPLTPAAAAPATAPPPAATAERTPPKIFRDCPNCPEMVVVPAGSFQMGANDDESRRLEVPTLQAGRDQPQHQVTIAKPFAFGKFDVTRGEFAAFVAATNFHPRPGCQTVMNGEWVPQPRASWEEPGFPQTERDPVVCMNEFEIRAYLSWLRRITGKDYRLPSEAEWEYAERGGTTTAYYWGNNIKDACAYENVGDQDYAAKYGGNNFIPCKDGFADLAPVGSFRPNPFGLYDMAGNISVIVADCWNETYAGAPTDGSAWMGGDCARRVARKAAFGNPRAWVFRAANREAESLIARRNRVGFRAALSLP